MRAGGKHNDLDNVGYTARHHTFFEMLGNFSFGDYFKERAIELAWQLVTKEFGLAKDRLTRHRLFRGRPRLRPLAEDRRPSARAASSASRPATISGRWATPAPAGPCSEIFYDHGADIPGGPPGSPDADGDRFIEIWNLVFMQFEQLPGGKRIDLPKPSIDTGMGLERIAAVLQGVHDNYDIDLFRALIAASVEMIGVPATGPNRASHRVIADHLRASSFLIADGVLPSNEGRGYVLRRIMRRAMRHAHLLGAEEPVMWRLVPTLVAEMGRAYPELIRAEPLIKETLRLEETRFRRTLERGLMLLDEATGGLEERRDAPRRRRLPALRHLRLPARSHPGRAEGARHRRRHRRLRPGDGAAEGGGAGELGRLRRGADRGDLVQASREARRDRVPRLHGPRPPRARSWRWSRAARGSSAPPPARTSPSSSTRRPFYAESGGQVADTGTIATEKGGRIAVQRRAEARRRPLRPLRHGRPQARSRPATPSG